MLLTSEVIQIIHLHFFFSKYIQTLPILYFFFIQRENVDKCKCLGQHKPRALGFFQMYVAEKQHGEGGGKGEKTFQRFQKRSFKTSK